MENRPGARDTVLEMPYTPGTDLVWVEITQVFLYRLNFLASPCFESPRHACLSFMKKKRDFYHSFSSGTVRKKTQSVPVLGTEVTEHFGYYV